MSAKLKSCVGENPFTPTSPMNPRRKALLSRLLLDLRHEHAAAIGVSLGTLQQVAYGYVRLSEAQETVLRRRFNLP